MHRAGSGPTHLDDSNHQKIKQALGLQAAVPAGTRQELWFTDFPDVSLAALADSKHGNISSVPILTTYNFALLPVCPNGWDGSTGGARKSRLLHPVERPAYLQSRTEP